MKVKIIFLIFLTAFLFLEIPGDQLDRLPLGESPLKTDLAFLEAGKIMVTRTGEAADMDKLVTEALSSDVILIGEYHDNWECHQFQADFIAALHEKHPRLIVGFEFFEHAHDPFLEQWRQGKLSEEELLKKTGWYARSALNYGYTRVVMEVIRKRGIRTIGLNVPRTLIRSVTMKGFESLSESEKTLFPGWEVRNPEHEYYIRSTFGPVAVQVPSWFDRIYGSQKCWDSVMAGSMQRILKDEKYKGYKGVIITGSAHVNYGLGIPFRYGLLDHDAKVYSVIPAYVEAGKEDSGEENPMMKMLAANMKPAAVFSRGIADAVLALALRETPRFPEWGFSGRMTKEGYEITGITEGGWADRQGLKKGDLVTAVDGSGFSTQEEMRMILSAKGWEDTVRFSIERSIPLQEKK